MSVRVMIFQALELQGAGDQKESLEDGGYTELMVGSVVSCRWTCFSLAEMFLQFCLSGREGDSFLVSLAADKH